MIRALTVCSIACLLALTADCIANAQEEFPPVLQQDSRSDYPSSASATRTIDDGAPFVDAASGDSISLLAPKARKALNEGDKALKAALYEEAESRFQEAYRLAPGDPVVNRFMGISLLALHRIDEAATFLNRSNSLEPNSASTLTALGLMNLEKGNFAGAVNQLELVLKLKPKDYWPHLLAADAYLQEHEFERAAAEAEQALRWSKGLAIDAEFTAGAAFAAMGRSAEALSYLRKFMKDAPSSPVIAEANAIVAQVLHEAGASQGKRLQSRSQLAIAGAVR